MLLWWRMSVWGSELEFCFIPFVWWMAEPNWTARTFGWAAEVGCVVASLTAIAFVWMWLCWRWWWSFYPHHHHLSSIWSLIMRRWTEYELLSLELIYRLHFYTDEPLCNDWNTFAVDNKLRLILGLPFNASASVTASPLIEKLWIADNYDERRRRNVFINYAICSPECVLSGLTNSWTCHQPNDWAGDRERKKLKIIN